MKKYAYSFLDILGNMVGPGGVVNIGAGAGVAQEGITLTPNSPTNDMNIGADGAGMHSLSADKSGTVTVRLQKTSDINGILMAMYELQRQSAAAWGQNTISFVDKNRGDSVTCQQVAFKTVPDLTFAAQAGLIEWTFDSVSMTRILGVSA